jgi:1,4-dihydroxy-2-naphthoyl-CoA synthase
LFNNPDFGVGRGSCLWLKLRPEISCRTPQKRLAAAGGLVNCVAAEESLENETLKFCHGLLAQSPAILALARQITGLGSPKAFEAALRETERVYLEELLPAEDAAEGVNAFLEKRAPKWKF